MSVEKVRVNFADAGKTILNDPIFPFEWIFFGSLARFRSCSPDRVGQHGANGNPVWGNGSISTEEVVEEVACRWWRQREKFVDEIDGIVASATVTKDMSCRVSVVRAEATATTNHYNNPNNKTNKNKQHLKKNKQHLGELN